MGDTSSNNNAPPSYTLNNKIQLLVLSVGNLNQDFIVMFSLFMNMYDKLYYDLPDISYILKKEVGNTKLSNP
jgi:hypothetical protein